MRKKKRVAAGITDKTQSEGSLVRLMNVILIVVVPILLVLLVIRSARVRSQEKQQLLNEQAQGILGSGFGGLREPHQDFFCNF